MIADAGSRDAMAALAGPRIELSLSPTRFAPRLGHQRSVIRAESPTPVSGMIMGQVVPWGPCSGIMRCAGMPNPNTIKS